MAEEAQKIAAVVAQEDEVLVVNALPPSDQKEPLPVPETEDVPKKPATILEESSPTSKSDAEEENIDQSTSFKEESTKVSDLLDPEKKALEELKQLIQEALNKQEFTASSATPPPPPSHPKEEEKTADEPPVVVADVPPPAPEEPEKPDAEIVGETKEEAISTPPAQSAGTEEAVVVAAVVEETITDNSAIDDDGAKTVEAIKETIVEVSSSVPPPPEHKQPEAAAAPPSEVAESEDVKPETEVPPLPPPEEVSLWEIPLLADERSDVILLKFLRARDFKVKEAFTMIKNTVKWRKEFGIDELVEQDLGNDLEKVAFMHGFDKEGHPVCYNVYGEFHNRELYQKTFSDEEKRQRFLRWRIQFLERSIRKLDFSPGGICTIVQVNDLKNSPGPGKWELRHATKQALQLLQDNYPEFVARQVFINVPWWYLAVNRMISPFLTQRTKSKFVFAGPSRSAETLFKYIAAEQVPVKYGGLSKDGEFGVADAVTEVIVKPATKQTVEFPVSETCLLTWEVRVVGWDVSYGAEFVPSAEDSYTVIIQKARKVASTEEPVVHSFKVGEPGKVVLTIDNPTSKKKKLLYRLKTKSSSD